VRREIIGYGSDDEEAFAAEIDLDAGRVERLRSLLNAGDDVELVNVYQLEGEALQLVAQWLDIQPQNNVDFFLESSA
jgi:hypothetical protein